MGDDLSPKFKWPKPKNASIGYERPASYTCAHPMVPYWHYMRDFMTETHYAAKENSDFKCELHRGAVPVSNLGKGELDEHKLVILNHFLTAPVASTQLATK